MRTAYVPLGNQANLDDARRQLEGAIRAATPYRPIKGRVRLDGKHANAFRPYCRPAWNIANRRAVLDDMGQPRRDGRGRPVEEAVPEYVHSVTIETSATPFANDNRDAEIQRAESLEIYRGGEAAIDAMMAIFFVRHTAIVVEARSPEQAIADLVKPSLADRMKAKRLARREA